MRLTISVEKPKMDIMDAVCNNPLLGEQDDELVAELARAMVKETEETFTIPHLCSKIELELSQWGVDDLAPGYDELLEDILEHTPGMDQVRMCARVIVETNKKEHPLSMVASETLNGLGVDCEHVSRGVLELDTMTIYIREYHTQDDTQLARPKVAGDKTVVMPPLDKPEELEMPPQVFQTEEGYP